MNSSVTVILETCCVFLFVDFCGSFLKENEKRMYCICFLQDDIPEVQEFFLVNLTSVELIMNHSTSSPPKLGKTSYTKLFLLFLFNGLDYITLGDYHYSFYIPTILG